MPSVGAPDESAKETPKKAKRDKKALGSSEADTAKAKSKDDAAKADAAKADAAKADAAKVKADVAKAKAKAKAEAAKAKAEAAQDDAAQRANPVDKPLAPASVPPLLPNSVEPPETPPMPSLPPASEEGDKLMSNPLPLNVSQAAGAGTAKKRDRPR